MKKTLPLLLAPLFGGLGVFAFSPFDYWFLIYPAVMGLLWLSQHPQRKTALLGAFLWGVGFFTLGVNWLHVSIHQFGNAPLWLSFLLVGLLSGYLALFPTLFVYLVQRFNVKSPMIFPVLWTLTEFLRGHLFTGFPWLQLGYSQIDSPFSGLAPLFGVMGLDFFVVLIAALLFTLGKLIFTEKGKKNSILGAGYFSLLVILLGLATLSKNISFVKEQKDQALEITLLQGAIPQQLKWDPQYVKTILDTYRLLVEENLDKGKLIILPEAVFPVLEQSLQPYLTDLEALAVENHREILLGSIHRNDQGQDLNSLVGLGNGSFPYQLETPNRYNKHHLVPFGEYVPFEALLRPLGNVFNLPMSNFKRGEEKQKNLLAQGKNFSPAICYEIIFGEEVRKNLTKDTDFLITLSNDAWFGDSWGPWQHLQIARMRALELGKPLIRATNSGITVFVNAKGNIISQAPQFITTSLTENLAPTRGQPPYAVLGNLPLYAIIFMLLIFHGFGTLIKKQIQKEAERALKKREENEI